MDMFILTIILVLYLFLIGYLGFKGYKGSKTSTDYMLAGRQIHPFVMALSYGATFISTSAIVGFGGVAGLFGLDLLWLTFFNIFVGIFVAFIFFGKKTREIGVKLDSHTFPEFLAYRFNSKFIQLFTGIVIFIFMPIYTSVVLIGAARFIETAFVNYISYDMALLIFSIIVAAYVIAGGLKGVMYSDALQGSIMFVGMLILLIFTYYKLGGIIDAHTQLSNITNLVPKKLVAIGHQGWTSMPKFGSSLWYTLITTLVLGVGIGVLAQPQLIVRFMTVKSNRELNRAVFIGGIFIFVMTGVSFIVGALSNVYFLNHPGFGKISIAAAKGNVDKIIPLFINTAFSKWFVYLFMITLLSAAMSTISSQFHAMGTAIGRDIYDVIFQTKNAKSSFLMTKIGIVIGILITIWLGYSLPIGVVARGTALFFGLCASTFLPAYTFALYWKKATKTGIISGILSGFCISAFWIVFVQGKEAKALGLCKIIFNKDVLLSAPWNNINVIVIALPLTFIITLLISLFTKKYDEQHLNRCGFK